VTTTPHFVIFMENPRWQIHSAQEYQILHGPSRSRFGGEDPNEDSVVFQRTLKGQIHRVHAQDDQDVQVPVPVGSALLFGGPEEGERAVFEGDEYANQWIRISGAGLRAHWTYMRHRFGNVVALDPTGIVVETITGIIEDFCSRRWVDSQRVHSWVNLLIDELSSRSRANLSPAEVACERIRESPFYPWSLKNLAAEAGCSREHLSRVFNKRFQAPPATWLRQRRLGRVIRLLESTEIPIAQIAEISGFGSLDSLGRLIQNVHGCTPSHIRLSKEIYTPTQDATMSSNKHTP
jgi:AraC-like DNA-binding protein